MRLRKILELIIPIRCSRLRNVFGDSNANREYRRKNRLLHLASRHRGPNDRIFPSATNVNLPLAVSDYREPGLFRQVSKTTNVEVIDMFAIEKVERGEPL